uniref:Uncharacterized protein n=1 Tax=Candidatus Kentrum sp. TC TaxID=2126339 RepID=A0A450YWN9_9GAMM|nr:MAG: hypothetical protein BECKTC1821E_GA0114239_10571 [Candidatus Kentron sp. TC]
MIKQTIGELLENNVVLDIEGIDRMYLNLYQPMLQTGGGVSTFFREEHKGAKVTSTASMSPMTKSFVRDIHGFAKREGVDVAPFAQGQNKDEITQAYLGTLDLWPKDKQTNSGNFPNPCHYTRGYPLAACRL